jgi:transposase
VERDPTRMCALPVGLVDVGVLGVEDDGGGSPLVVHVESTGRRSGCPECGLLGWSKDRPKVTLVDLPCFGRPTRLVWHKHRLCCPDGCLRSWTVEVPAIAPPRQALTTRAGKWATIQVGRHGRTVNEV